MYSADTVKKVIERFPEVTVPPVPEKFVRDPEVQITVPLGKIKEVAWFLKNDPSMAFDLPNFMTAVDYIKDNLFEVIYYLTSTQHKTSLVLKTHTSRSEAEVPSLTVLWSGFNFQEREVYDLFGIKFQGHPNLTRILMWEGFPGHPLRKDYVHVTDFYDSGLEIGTPGLDEKGVPKEPGKEAPHGH